MMLIINVNIDEFMTVMVDDYLESMTIAEYDAADTTAADDDDNDNDDDN